MMGLVGQMRGRTPRTYTSDCAVLQSVEHSGGELVGGVLSGPVRRSFLDLAVTLVNDA